MPGVTLPSIVTSISTRLAVALGLTVCAAIFTGRTSLGSGNRSLPSMTMVVLWPIVRPRSETLLIVGAAEAAEAKQARTAADSQPRVVRRVMRRLRVQSSCARRDECRGRQVGGKE